MSDLDKIIKESQELFILLGKYIIEKNKYKNLYIDTEKEIILLKNQIEEKGEYMSLLEAECCRLKSLTPIQLVQWFRQINEEKNETTI